MTNWPVNTQEGDNEDASEDDAEGHGTKTIVSVDSVEVVSSAGEHL